jgi:long-subunit fatty acid transport protein
MAVDMSVNMNMNTNMKIKNEKNIHMGMTMNMKTGHKHGHETHLKVTFFITPITDLFSIGTDFNGDIVPMLISE